MPLPPRLLHPTPIHLISFTFPCTLAAALDQSRCTAPAPIAIYARPRRRAQATRVTLHREPEPDPPSPSVNARTHPQPATHHPQHSDLSSTASVHRPVRVTLRVRLPARLGSAIAPRLPSRTWTRSLVRSSCSTTWRVRGSLAWRTCSRATLSPERSDNEPTNAEPSILHLALACCWPGYVAASGPLSVLAGTRLACDH